MDSTECTKKEWDFLKPLKTTLKCKNVLNAVTDNEGNIYITGLIRGEYSNPAFEEDEP